MLPFLRQDDPLQFHHDGGFSASSPPPPALVAMGCEAAPRWGGGQAEAGGAPPADDRYRALPKDRLKEELRGRGLPVSGTKAVLVARLVAHDEAQAAAGDGGGGGA